MSYQTSMFSTLLPDVALDERVVLLGDSRLPDCLRELSSPSLSHIGLDCEFFEAEKGPFQSKADISYWKAALRLLQVGLPSGRVIVCDFGGLLDDRDRGFASHQPILTALKPVIESRIIPVVGMALLTEYLMLRIHLGWKMRCMRDIMLYSQVLYGGVAPAGKNGSPSVYYEPWGKVLQPCLRHHMQAICARLGITVDKTEQKSDWAGRLTARQYNYAALDTTYPISAWKRLSSMAKADEITNSIEAEREAQPVFCECEFNGLPVDEERARKNLATWLRIRDEFWRPFKETFPGASPTTPASVAKVFGEALDVRVCGGCGLEYDPLAQAPSKHKPWQHLQIRCPSCDGPKEGFVRKMERTFTEKTTVVRGKGTNRTTKVVENPRTADDALIAYEHIPYVKSLLEGRATSSCLAWLQGVVDNMWGGRIRTDFRQIAGGFQEHGTKDGEAGKGMGRSAAGRPVNTQNPSVLQPSHKKAGAPSVRDCIRPASGRALIVVDLSQAHMRIAAQASQDPQMLRTFREGLDMHLVLALSLMAQKGTVLSYEEGVQIKKDKTHPMHDQLVALRNGSKSIGYGSLNMQGGETLKRTAETAHEPVYMTVEEATERRDAWRGLHPVMYQFQRDTIKKANSFNHDFSAIGVQGKYGEVRALTGRRLFLVKNWQEPKYAWQKKGSYSVKGTDCVSAVWMMTEADAIKRAGGWMLEVFDQHPEWNVKFANMCHDEYDLDCIWDYRFEVAEVAHQMTCRAMVWAGIVDIPVCASDADPKKLVAECWAEK